MPRKTSRLTEAEYRKHLMFCEPERGNLMIKGVMGWMPCTPKLAEFLDGQPRVDPSRLFKREPNAFGVPRRHTNNPFRIFIVPGVTEDLMEKGGAIKRRDWFDEAKWRKGEASGDDCVTW
jgi:hypothetical protein